MVIIFMVFGGFLLNLGHSAMMHSHSSTFLCLDIMLKKKKKKLVVQETVSTEDVWRSARIKLHSRSQERRKI